MKSQLLSLTYEIELQPGEPDPLPPDWLTALGAGRWKITIEPASPADTTYPIKDHGAFLNSYAAADEGLYDHIAG